VLRASVGVFAAIVLSSSVARAEPRQARFDAGAFLVPFGMNYTRSAMGASTQWVAPLSRDPGVLWNTTEVRVGVRDLYGWVNNHAAAFVEITPIAVLKIRGELGWDAFVKPPFNGGLRTLTPEGRRLLDEGLVGRNDPGALDWSNDDGLDDRAHFNAPIAAHGLRARVMPTLQAKVGPFVAQYTFTFDYADQRGPGRSVSDIYHDTFTFTLRKVRDVAYVHEALIGWQFEGVRDSLILGAQLRHHRVLGTGLESLGVFGVALFQRDAKVTRDAFSPFALAQLGSFVRDPMHQGDVSWVVAIGADFRGI
jgi:hypothetical protein